AGLGRVRPVSSRPERPAFAAEVPETGEKNVGALRVDGDAAAAPGEVRAREDQIPGLPAVDRLVETAIGTVAPQLARRAGVDGVGVARVDRDLRDPLALLQAHVRPALAAVDRLVDSVSNGHRVARPGLPGPDPDHLRVLRVDGDGPDRLHRLPVEDGLEGHAPVLALPHPTAR